MRIPKQQNLEGVLCVGAMISERFGSDLRKRSGNGLAAHNIGTCSTARDDSLAQVVWIVGGFKLAHVQNISMKQVPKNFT